MPPEEKNHQRPTFSASVIDFLPTNRRRLDLTRSAGRETIARMAQRLGRTATVLTVGVIAMLLPASSLPAPTRTTGKQSFHGGLVVSSASGQRKVLGTVVAASGVFNGVGHIVERPNRPGDSNRVSRDDLVFATGVIHIVNKSGHTAITTDPKTCIVKIEIEQTTTVAGGSGRFAGATGRFTGKVVGSALVPRKPDGSCNLRKPPTSEVDTVMGAGTLTF